LIELACSDHLKKMVEKWTETCNSVSKAEIIQIVPEPGENLL